MVKKKAPPLLETRDLPYKMLQVVRYIEKHYNKLLTLETISTHVRINRRHLSRVFKKKVGITPMDYLDELRFTRAQELLDDPNLRIRVVANRVGIPPLEFSKWFREKTGMLPMEYRKEEKSDHRPKTPDSTDSTDSLTP